MPGGIGQERADLTILGPARRTGVLPLHPGRPHTLLDEPGLIHDQHRVPIAEMLHHIITQVVAQHVGVPARPAQQPLHRIRRGITGELGQRPPVLALQPGQQTTHVRHGLAAWLDPPEPMPHPHTQLIQPSSPILNVDAHPAKPAGDPKIKSQESQKAVAVLGVLHRYAAPPTGP